MLNTTTCSCRSDARQTKLLAVIKGEMTRAQLLEALSLSDRKSFSLRYLQPALQAGLIEMTIPAKPNSRLQRYKAKLTTKS
jgi:hypothetical protein